MSKTHKFFTATGDALKDLLRPVVAEVAQEIVFPLAQIRNPKYTGGVYCQWEENTTQAGILLQPTPLAQFPIGELFAVDGQSAADRWVSYTRNSWVKNQMLNFCHRDIASALSANPNHEVPILRTYQGGIRTIIKNVRPTLDDIRRLISFSGLPADLDEMLVVIVALRVEYCDMQQARAIAKATKNESLRIWLATA